MKGWVKISRKILKWQWYKNGNMVRLFLHLILKAEYAGANSGVLATSLRTLCDETGLTFKVIRNCLKQLVRTGEITIEATQQNSVITICNYASYQAGGNVQGHTPGTQKGTQKGTQNPLANNSKSADYKTETASEGTQKGTQKGTPRARALMEEIKEEIKEKEIYYVDKEKPPSSPAFSENEFNEHLAEAEKSAPWLAAMAENLACSVEAVKELLRGQFRNHCFLLDKGHPDARDFKIHFNHWTNKRRETQSTAKIGNSDSAHAARQEEFRRHILDQLARGDDDAPDVSSYY